MGRVVVVSLPPPSDTQGFEGEEGGPLDGSRRTTRNKRTAIMLFMACICLATIGLFMRPCICAICAFTFFAVSGSFIAFAYAS